MACVIDLQSGSAGQAVSLAVSEATKRTRRQCEALFAASRSTYC
jgi:hypothetical protein